jgi:hypothetical protein
MNVEYLEGEASPKFLPCLPSATLSTPALRLSVDITFKKNVFSFLEKDFKRVLPNSRWNKKEDNVGG